MHDPMTLAFGIPNPFAARYSFGKRWLDRPALAVIWHKDPCRGSDDSCGFSVPHLTKKQREALKGFAWAEAHDPYFLREMSKTFNRPRIEAEAMYRALILHVADLLGIRVSWEDASVRAAERMHRPDCSDPAGLFCFVPGYHSNFKEDLPDQRELYFHGVLCNLARWQVLLPRRRWWQHPRWHLHHWRIQVPLLQALRRFVFERCDKCGSGFRWNESVMGNWDGDRIWHMNCDPSRREVSA